jgi:hypothetical protein
LVCRGKKAKVNSFGEASLQKLLQKILGKRSAGQSREFQEYQCTSIKPIWLCFEVIRCRYPYVSVCLREYVGTQIHTFTSLQASGLHGSIMQQLRMWIILNKSTYNVRYACIQVQWTAFANLKIFLAFVAHTKTCELSYKEQHCNV